VSARLGNPALASSAQDAYLHAMTHRADRTAAVVAAAAGFTAALLPGKPAAAQQPDATAGPASQRNRITRH
jgi:hypothetical protein